ncbi:hypothetical protein Dimus_028931 [Dionaea muscipula]
MKKGNPEYALVDSYFFIYIENLWKNWDPDSEPDLSQPSKIPEELTNYVWGLNPEWGIEWWNVRHLRGHEDTSSTDLRRGWIFQVKRQKKKNRSFSNTKDSLKNVPKQEYADSCGIWTLYFAERIISGMAINVDLQQNYITGMRKHYSLQIFANSD